MNETVCSLVGLINMDNFKHYLKTIDTCFIVCFNWQVHHTFLFLFKPQLNQCSTSLFSASSQ